MEYYLFTSYIVIRCEKLLTTISRYCLLSIKEIELYLRSEEKAVLQFFCIHTFLTHKIELFDKKVISVCIGHREISLPVSELYSRSYVKNLVIKF